MNDICSKCENKKVYDCDKCGASVCREHGQICDYFNCTFNICDDCGEQRGQQYGYAKHCPKHADEHKDLSPQQHECLAAYTKP